MLGPLGQNNDPGSVKARGVSRRRLLQGATAGVVAAAMGPLVAGRSMAQDSTPTPQRGGEVNMLIRKPVTLNPNFSTSGNEQQIERLIFGALVKMNDKLEPVLDLAEKVEATPDAKTYTFTLREGLVFNDGTPLTSRDVAFSIETAVDKRTGSLWRGRFLAITGAEAFGDQKAETISGIATPDERTIAITLDAPDASFLITLCDYSGFAILPEHIHKDVAPEAWANILFMEPSVGAGAYNFVKYEVDQYIELQRNETYGGPAPYLDRILLSIRTPDVALAEIERGELDIMPLPLDEAEGARSFANVSVISVQSPSMTHIVIHNQVPHLQDKRVRQAMMHAMDRQAMIDAILGGEGEITNSPIFGPAWMGVPEGLNPYEYDVDKAKQLLSEAGWDPNQKVVALVVNLDQDPSPPIIQNQFKDAGINLELLQVEITELIRRISSEEVEFEMFFNGGDTYRADPNISSLFYSTANLAPAGTNFSRYSNPTLDDLYVQGRGTTDLAERKRIYTEAAKILNEDVPNLYQWSPNSLFAVNNRVQGFKGPGYADNRLWNAEEWWVTQ
ncbi:MAG: peptide/nickel transport system substrate-binding protein [Thermomicrobiales bacterium]|nr:peptide/nickel transport system substrate-binding protein [Thermomicrobiales bacterium]